MWNNRYAAQLYGISRCPGRIWLAENVIDLNHIHKYRYVKLKMPTYQVSVHGEGDVFQHYEDVGDGEPLQQAVDGRRREVTSCQHGHIKSIS